MNDVRGSRRDFLKHTGVGALGASLALGARPGFAEVLARPSKHVLLISVDGLHAIDLAHWVEANPASVLAQLSAKGYTYTRAGTSQSSDSFPGLIALVTGDRPFPPASGMTSLSTGSSSLPAAWAARARSRCTWRPSTPTATVWTAG